MHRAQLTFEAHVVEYVHYVAHATKAKVPAKAKQMEPALNMPLRGVVPLYGPRFVPSTFTDASKRRTTAAVNPEIAYLKPITIIHPFYFPDLTCCPQDASHENVAWDGWTSIGSCHVHGLWQEETALGYQL